MNDQKQNKEGQSPTQPPQKPFNPLEPIAEPEAASLEDSPEYFDQLAKQVNCHELQVTDLPDNFVEMARNSKWEKRHPEQAGLLRSRLSPAKSLEWRELQKQKGVN